MGAVDFHRLQKPNPPEKNNTKGAEMKTLFYQNQEIQLNYSTTLNHLIPHQLYQCGLSLPALGLASYLYTLPKQWRLSVTHLSKQLAMSKNTCRKYLKEIFTNDKAREVFKVMEVEINTYDFEEGLTAYDYASDKEELENFTSSVAKDVSEENKKRVLLVQTKEQRYLLNLALNLLPKTTNPIARNVSALACPKPALGVQGGSADQAGECALARNELNSVCAQNLSTINKNLLQDSYKDSSSKRTRAKNFSEFLDLQSFSDQEQEAIKLWITYKQETSKSKLKPSQIDFQLRKITRLKEQGQDICAIIEKSLDMGWTGLFAMPSTPQAERFAISRAKLTPKIPKNIGAKAILCVQ